jgi:hypothetical protein
MCATSHTALVGFAGVPQLHLPGEESGDNSEKIIAFTRGVIQRHHGGD